MKPYLFILTKLNLTLLKQHWLSSIVFGICDQNSPLPKTQFLIQKQGPEPWSNTNLVNFVQKFDKKTEFQFLPNETLLNLSNSVFT